jgi:glycosyltransferase involved in cell wall biosynthesis
MRILQFCNKSPYPPKEGGPIAMNAITELLTKQGHSVKILAINTPKYTVSSENVDESYYQKTKIEWVWVDTRFRIPNAFKSLSKNTSYHVDRFRSKQLEEKLTELLSKEDFDVVILETVYLAVYVDAIRKHSSAKIVLRAHNVEHLIWKQIAKNTKKGLKRLYLSILAKQLERFEKTVISSFDAVWCISPTDKLWFCNQNKTVSIKVVPFTVDIDESLTNEHPFRCDNLFSIASMDWYPNLEGIQWFLDNVWEKIHGLYPDIIFRVAGRNMPDKLKYIQIPNVEIIGEVSDAKLFMQENGVLVVPLLSGSGVRIKIVEAMSIGKAVITTSVGLEGIMAKDREHVLIANTPQEFIEAVKFCKDNPHACKQIGKNAQQLIKEKHNVNRMANDEFRQMKIGNWKLKIQNERKYIGKANK